MTLTVLPTKLALELANFHTVARTKGHPYGSVSDRAVLCAVLEIGRHKGPGDAVGLLELALDCEPSSHDPIDLMTP